MYPISDNHAILALKIKVYEYEKSTCLISGVNIHAKFKKNFNYAQVAITAGH